MPALPLQCRFYSHSAAVTVSNLTENAPFDKHFSLLAGHGEQMATSYFFPRGPPGPR